MGRRSLTAFAADMDKDKVAEAFELNAQGMSIKSLPEHFEKEYGIASTEYSWSQLFHRNRCFVPSLYEQVSAENETAVTDKFFRKHKGRKPVEKVTKRRDELLHEALDAYRVWENARQACIHDGVTDDTLKAWIKITLEVETQDESKS